MWWGRNGLWIKNLLAVKGRIFVGLEEGDSETADKTGSKVGITGQPKKTFQEREIRGLHGRKKPHPLFLLPPEEGKPMVELFLVNKEAPAKFFYGRKVQEIFSQDAQDKEKAVGRIRDDEIRKDGMGMAAGTDKTQDAEAVPDRLAANKINQGTVIIGMDGAGSLYPTAGAGLQFRAESGHEGIKKFF